MKAGVSNWWAQGVGGVVMGELWAGLFMLMKGRKATYLLGSGSAYFPGRSIQAFWGLQRVCNSQKNAG